MEEIILKVDNLMKEFTTNFKKNTVLNGVNINVKKGEIYGFLGPNGTGKTTTLKCILGFLKPNSGTIEIFGENIVKNHSVYKKIGYAPENTYFYDHLNGIEFLIFMGQLSGMDKQDAELVGQTLIEKLGLAHASDRYVKLYSKGMKQRLGLAASLMMDPELIFWDEPMSGLDPLGRVLVKKLMIELKEKGKTVFFNTHILGDVQEIADRFGIIYEGKILHEDYTKNVSNLEDFFIKTIEEKTGKALVA